MNLLQTFFKKALSRINALSILMVTGPVLLAQDTANDTAGVRSTSGENVSDAWYNEGWVWFVIIIVAIILILAFTRKSDKTQYRNKDKR